MVCGFSFTIERSGLLREMWGLLVVFDCFCRRNELDWYGGSLFKLKIWEGWMEKATGGE